MLKRTLITIAIVVGALGCEPTPAGASPGPIHHWSEASAEVRAEHSPEAIQAWIDGYWRNVWIDTYWARVVAYAKAVEAARAARPAVPRNSVWDALARCESGGNWSINTGNGYYGGLQFSLRSWRAVGGTGYPHQASRETQIAMGERLRRIQGWGAWPACSRKLGLR